MTAVMSGLPLMHGPRERSTSNYGDPDEQCPACPHGWHGTGCRGRVIRNRQGTDCQCPGAYGPSTAVRVRMDQPDVSGPFSTGPPRSPARAVRAGRTTQPTQP